MQVDTVTRPYAFIKFDTFIQKTKKLYQDSRSQRNLAMLNDDLAGGCHQPAGPWQREATVPPGPRSHCCLPAR